MVSIVAILNFNDNNLSVNKERATEVELARLRCDEDRRELDYCHVRQGYDDAQHEIELLKSENKGLKQQLNVSPVDCFLL